MQWVFPNECGIHFSILEPLNVKAKRNFKENLNETPHLKLQKLIAEAVIHSSCVAGMGAWLFPPPNPGLLQPPFLVLVSPYRLDTVVTILSRMPVETDLLNVFRTHIVYES